MKLLRLKAFPTALLFIGIFLVSGHHAQAASTCASITSGFPVSQDWRNSQSLVDENDFEWKRAIISSPKDSIRIPESGPLLISGIAERFSHVRIFIFSPTTDSFGNVQKPGDGTCFMAGTANEFGAFQLEIHSSLLWQNIGQTLMIDAFYQTAQKASERPKGSLYTFSIGATSLPPTTSILETTVEAWHPTQNVCTPLCDGSTFRIASEIEPDKYPQVARNSFNFPDLSQPNTTAENILLTKSAAHTLHAFAKNSEIDPTIIPDLDSFAKKALIVEGLKRIILGLEGVGQTNRRELTAAILVEKEKSGPPEIKSLLTAIKNALTYPENSPERDQAIDQITTDLITLLRLNDADHFLPDATILKEILANRETLPASPNRSVAMLPPFTENRPLLDKLDCPFNNFTNRTIIRFNGEYLLANQTDVETVTSTIPVTLDEGEYRMIFASYDEHDGTQIQNNEIWHLVLIDSAGNDILFTNDISDFPSDVDSIVEVVHNSIQVPAGTVGVYGSHGVAPSVNAESVAPVCAALDRIDPPPPANVRTGNLDIWAYDFQQILVLWTNMIESNPCIIPSDGKTEMQFRDRAAFKQNQSDYNMCPGETWINSGSIGADPVVYLKREGILSPDFVDININFSERPFDQPEGWRVTQQDKTVSYRYIAQTPFKPDSDSMSCFAPQDIAQYSQLLGKQLGLPQAVKKLLEQELQVGFGKSTQMKQVTLAQPQQIGQRIKWQLDGKPAQILPLYFHVSETECSEKSLQKASISNSADDGYDIGIY